MIVELAPPTGPAGPGPGGPATPRPPSPEAPRPPRTPQPTRTAAENWASARQMDAAQWEMERGVQRPAPIPPTGAGRNPHLAR